MPVQFVIGRAGSGKSAYALGRIRDILRERPEGPPLILLVPEQATFQAEYALASDPGLAGMLRAQVLSFRRLAWRVMQETGGTARIPIGDSGKAMLLYKILHRHKDHLKIFQTSIDQMGFIGQLNQLFTEWRRYGITAEILERFQPEAREDDGDARLLRDKLADLRAVYAELENELSRLYTDGEDQLSRLAGQLWRCRTLREAQVWVDGFHGFTPQERNVLEQLMLHTRQVTVALCLDRPYSAGEAPEELDLFHPTARTMVSLQESALRLGVPVLPPVELPAQNLPRFRESPTLALLERSLASRSLRPAGEWPRERKELQLCEAVNRRAEVEGAAREMLRLAREQGARWRDMAVRVRNLEAYGDLLQTVFRDYGIPFFMDRKRPVLHHPLIELIRSALEVVRFNWRYDAVFRCVKTEFFFPLERDADGGEAERDRACRLLLDRLENEVLARGIQGTLWKHDGVWQPRARTGLDGKPQEPDREEREYYRMLNRGREWIVGPLGRFEQAISRAETARGKAEALYGLLEEIGVPKRLERWSAEAGAAGQPEKAREHLQIWGGIVDLLDQLVELAGEEKLPLELFSAMLETGMESMRLGLVPPALDQVLVGSIDRSRSAQMKYAFIIGVNDGELPARIPESGVLTEAERERLLDSGLPMAEGSRRRLLDEQFLIYTTLCGPSRRLWLSYALADEEGRTLLPSEIIRQMERRFPGLGRRPLPAEPSPELPESGQLEFVAHPRKTLSHLTVQMKQWLQGKAVSRLWWETYNWFVRRTEWRQPMERMVRALMYTNLETPLRPETCANLYGSHLKASVSRMEQYIACPFSQFAGYGLGLEERRIYRLGAPDIGQLFHAALSEMALLLQDERADWASLGKEELAVRAAEVVERLAPRLRGEILLSSERYGYIARKLREIVGTASVMMAEHARHSVFKPVGLELGFGENELLPPLRIPLENGRVMDVRGRIDRIDRADGENGTLLRIIDYKSSQTMLRLPAVYYGLSLQMLTYLDVVLTHAERWLGRPALPAGVLYFHVHNPVIQSANPMTPEKADSEWKRRFKMKGLVLSDAETARMMDDGLRKAPGHSQRIPVALKADGEFYKSSQVASPAQWDRLRGYVRGMIRRIGTGIAEGDVSISPYRLGQEVPCTRCPYRPVCQFDPLFAGNDYRELPSLGREEVWKAIEENPAAEKTPFVPGRRRKPALPHLPVGPEEWTAQSLEAAAARADEPSGEDDGEEMNRADPGKGGNADEPSGAQTPGQHMD
jgi:ATP-dependent helicase/nuclease subunit B